MKNVKIISCGIAMLLCYLSSAQEKANTQTTTQHTNYPIDTILNSMKQPTATHPIIVCSPSFPPKKEPLYILDEVLINSRQLSKINPNDIKDIKVLKGTEATSLYGNQGVNGVLIIRTKKATEDSIY